MSSAILRKRPRSLALRLTCWYAGVFVASLLVAFLVVHLLTLSILRDKTDKDLEEDLEEFAGYMEQGGLARVQAEMGIETLGEEAESIYFRLWSDDGQIIATTDLSGWSGLQQRPDPVAALADGEEAVLETVELPQTEHGVRVGYRAIGPGAVLELGQSLEEEAELAEAFVRAFLIALVAIVLLAAPIGWLLARRALHGVREITRVATEIADGVLDRRVPAQADGDELDRLASTFNLMVDRIETLIGGMREMTDTLAHDLRSPLARIRAAAETMLADERGAAADWQAMASDVITDTDRMLEIINVTLDITEAESGAARLERSEFDLAEVVEAAADLFQTIAEDRRIVLRVDLPDRCAISGDRYRMQRVVANLLDNALKYTQAGGSVRVSLVDEGDWVRVVFADSGPGISEQDVTRIFERFYRCDRSRSQPGNGLGLSLALAFVRIHGGRIEVESEPGLGSTFTVIVPKSRND